MVKQLLESRMQIPTFGPTVVLSLTLIFVSLTFARGADWLIYGDPDTVSDLLLDLDFGLRRLGGMLVVSSLLFFAAVASQRHVAVWAAHALLACAFFAMSITIGGAVYEHGAGVAELASPIGGLVWHGLMAHLIGVVPHPLKEARHAAVSSTG